VFVPCANEGAGETVLLLGELHIVFHITITEDGHVTVKSQANPQGVSGVGSTTGDKYQGTGVTSTTATFDEVEEFPAEFTLINNFRIIGQGPAGNDLLVHTTDHVTVNANGEMTADVHIENVTCEPT
jgi:hypothetical protein